MGGLRREGMLVAAFAEIARAFARCRVLVRARRFRHAGKSYLVYRGRVPELRPGTLVATGYGVSIIADGHSPTVDELAAALEAIEAKRSSESARGGA